MSYPLDDELLASQRSQFIGMGRFLAPTLGFVLDSVSLTAARWLLVICFTFGFGLRTTDPSLRMIILKKGALAKTLLIFILAGIMKKRILSAWASKMVNRDGLDTMDFGYPS